MKSEIVRYALIGQNKQFHFRGGGDKTALLEEITCVKCVGTLTSVVILIVSSVTLTLK